MYLFVDFPFWKAQQLSHDRELQLPALGRPGPWQFQGADSGLGRVGDGDPTIKGTVPVKEIQ